MTFLIWVMTAFTRTAIACSGGWVTGVLPENGSDVPPDVVFHIFGDPSDEQPTSNRTQLFNSAGAPVTLQTTVLQPGVVEARPLLALAPGDYQLVVWEPLTSGNVRHFQEFRKYRLDPVAVRVHVRAGATAALPAPVSTGPATREVRDQGNCGTETAVIFPVQTLGALYAAGVWEASGSTALDYERPPDRWTVGGTDALVFEWGGLLSSGSGLYASRIGVRYVDLSGRWSPPVELAVPDPMP